MLPARGEPTAVDHADLDGSTLEGHAGVVALQPPPGHDLGDPVLRSCDQFVDGFFQRGDVLDGGSEPFLRELPQDLERVVVEATFGLDELETLAEEQTSLGHLFDEARRDLERLDALDLLPYRLLGGLLHDEHREAGRSGGGVEVEVAERDGRLVQCEVGFHDGIPVVMMLCRRRGAGTWVYFQKNGVLSINWG